MFRHWYHVNWCLDQQHQDHQVLSTHKYDLACLQNLKQPSSFEIPLLCNVLPTHLQNRLEDLKREDKWLYNIKEKNCRLNYVTLVNYDTDPDVSNSKNSTSLMSTSGSSPPSALAATLTIGIPVLGNSICLLLLFFRKVTLS